MTHMTCARRTFTATLAATAALAIGLGSAAFDAHAQDAYPNRTVTLVVPYPPGGATDVIGRVVAQQLSLALGQQVVVDNRAGAAGNIGAAMVSRAKPDGYTLLLGALTSHSINAALYGSTVQYDLDKGFSAVAIVGSVPLVFVVNPDVSAKSLTELIALAKAKPGALSFASAGNGSPQHLAGEQFKHVAGVNLLHVPYKGSGPAMTDLIGGQVQTMIETAPAAQPHIAAGRLRPLAVTSAQRAPSLPDVPTAAEAGLKDFEVSSMFGVLAPAGTPPAIVDRLASEVRKMLDQAEVREALLKQGVVAGFKGGNDAAGAIRAEVAKWTKVIKDAGIKAE